jgi:hypothetical protein
VALMADLLSSTSAALLTTLSGGTALIAALGGTAIYDTQAPDAATAPYVVFNHQGGGFESLTSAELENNVWLVKVYSATTMSHAQTIYALVDALIHRRNLTITGATTFWCAREDNVQLVENKPNNTRLFMRGGLYRIRTNKGA